MQFVGLAESADEIFIDWTDLLFFLSLFARAYLDMKELKEILQLDGSTHLNVFFANSSDEDLAGVATWPWDKEALTHLGRKNCAPFHFTFTFHPTLLLHYTSWFHPLNLQAVSCSTLPSTAPLATRTPWSTRSATASDCTTSFGVYRRSSLATTPVWRRSLRWRRGTCAPTPTQLPSTKAATIRNRAMKPAALGNSRTRPLTTT